MCGPLRDPIDLWVSSSSMVGIQAGVGSNIQTLHVHEALLRRRSRHCASILAHADTVDAVFERVIRLPYELEIVNLYIHFLYMDSPLYNTTVDCLKDIGNNDGLAQLYVLAEFLDDAATKNAILRMMVEASCDVAVYGSRSIPTASMVSILYAGTDEPSVMRRFLVHAVAGLAKERWFGDCGERHLPEEFLIDLGRKMVKRRETGKRVVSNLDARNDMDVEDDASDDAGSFEV